MLQYAAAHKLGLAVSFVPVDQMAKVAEKYYAWCDEAGWQPTPDQIVYRGSIYLAETDMQAEAWLEGVKRAGPVPGGIAMRPAVSRAIQAARAGEAFDLRNILAGGVQGDVAGAARGLSFMGGPDTVVKQLQPFRPNRHVPPGNASEVSSRSAQARNEPKLDRVESHVKDNRNGSGRRFGGQRSRRASGNRNYVDLPTHQIGSQRWKPVVVSLRPSIFDRNIPPLDVTNLAQSLVEGG